MTVREASPGERQFWTHDQLHPEARDLALVVGLYELDGALDASAVRSATATLIERHEILRSSFHRAGAGVDVVRHPAADVPVEVSAVVAADRDDALALAHRLAECPIELDRPPLVRVALVSWADDRHLLVIISHHAVLDGAGLGVLTDEFGRLLDPQADPLPAPAELAPVRAAEQAHRTSDAGRRDLDYWCDQLRDIDSERIDPDEQSHRADTASAHVDGMLLEQVRELATTLRASTTILLLTAWADLLLDHLPGAAVVIGVPVSGRSDPGHRDVVGLLMNTIPLVIPRQDGTFAERVGAVRRLFLTGLRHHRAPLTEVARAARPGRSPELYPLYRAMFSQGEQSTVSFGGRAVERIPFGGETTEAPLSLVVVDEASGRIRVDLSVESDSRLLGDVAAEQSLHELLRRLRAAVSESEEASRG